MIAGLLWPLLLTGPPWAGSWLLSLALAVSAACLALTVHRPGAPCKDQTSFRLLMGLSLALLSSAWCCWHIERGLAARWSGPPFERVVSGRVVSLPEQRGERLSFRFLADADDHLQQPMRLDVRWFRSTRTPEAGERWRLRLRIAPPRDRLNFAGSDSERFWFAERVHALASVLANDAERLAPAEGAPVQQWRKGWRERLAHELEGLPGHGLIQALALGERSGLSPALNAAMRATGTGHLLAISGLHVGLVALFSTLAGRLLLILLGWRFHRWPARRVAPLIGLMAAAIYALLAGFDTSPRRALFMVTAVVLALVVRRHVSPWQSWLLALSLVLLADPLAPLRAGFWLSFAAVGILLWLFLGRLDRAAGVSGLLRAQLGLMLAMLPLTLGWFGFASFSALIVNLVAIPWVSFITLPALLLGLPLLAGSDVGIGSVSGGLETLPVHLAARSAALLEQGLIRFHGQFGTPGLHAASPSFICGAFATLGALLCLLPRGLRMRPFGLLLIAPLLLASFLPKQALPPGTLRVDVLDVGQGQAVLLQVDERRLLVDTGPGVSGHWSLAERVILPAVIDTGVGRPDLIFLSHGDSDHGGGLADLKKAWPGIAVSASLEDAHGRRRNGGGVCHDQHRWRWADVDFQVLHPSPWLPYRGNDSSCVLEVSAPGGAVLLPGDIGKHVERRLIRRPGTPYRLLLAPHHGSRSSSSSEFIAWAQPELTVFSTAYGNRFGFPHSEVLSRYARRGLAVTDTAACGGLRFTLHSHGRLEGQSARRSRAAFWRYGAASHCPGAAGSASLTPANAFRYHAGHTEKNLTSKE